MSSKQLREEYLNFFGERSNSGDGLSRFVLGCNHEEVDAYVSQCKREIKNAESNIDLICLSDFSNILRMGDERSVNKYNIVQSPLEIFENLLKHAEECKNLIVKKRCKSLFDFNKKFKVKDFCRTVVFVENFDELLRDSGEATKVKELILKLIRLEKYSGVSVVVCSFCESYETVDFHFINSFLNRILFKTENERVVEDISHGMYNSTDCLDYNHYYYFDYGHLNGKMLSV